MCVWSWVFKFPVRLNSHLSKLGSWLCFVLIEIEMETGPRSPSSAPIYPGDFYVELTKERPDGIPLDSYIPTYITHKLKAQLHLYSNTKNIRDFPDFLPKSAWTSIKNLLRFVQVLKRTEGLCLNKDQLVQLFISEVQSPPLDLIWVLCGISSKTRIFPMSVYLLGLGSRNERLQSFMEQVLWIAFAPMPTNPKYQKRFTQIVQDFTYEFMSLGFMELDERSREIQSILKIHQSSREILSKILEGFMNPVPGAMGNNFGFISTVLQSAPVTGTVKKNLFQWHLSRFLQESGGPVPEDVLRYQEKYAAPILSTALVPKTGLISLFIGEPFSPEEVLNILKEAISGNVTSNSIISAQVPKSGLSGEGRSQGPKSLDFQSQVPNWPNILLTLRLWDKNEGARDNSHRIFYLLNQYIRELLEEGLENQWNRSIAAAFILARHSSLISPIHFHRYEKWWTGILETESSTIARTAEGFAFLCKVLQDWVPVEPVCFLQVHATYWPYIPHQGGPGTLGNLRALWTEYVQMSKERISEYRELEEALMDYEPNPNNPVQYDVEMAIKTFENSRKIPNTIAQILMFKRKYYNEHFLPALLKKPAGIPQSDGRLCLVEALNADGKIPTELYVHYKKNQQ